MNNFSDEFNHVRNSIKGRPGGMYDQLRSAVSFYLQQKISRNMSIHLTNELMFNISSNMSLIVEDMIYE